MEGPVVQTFTSADGTRRLHIFQRTRDATFGFEESRWDAADQCWIPIGPQVDSFTDTFGRAIAEARGRVRWLGESLRDATESSDA
jgi:hypothetical protein